MTIAVSGASGFIGRHVLNALVAMRENVVALVRTPPIDVVPGVRYEILDLANILPQDYDRIGSPATLVHLAWEGLPNYTARRHFEEELPRQYAFLRALVQAGLPSAVIAGTCFEYGMTNGALSETMPTRPDNAYALAKTTLYAQLRLLQRDQPFNLTWARLFYLWGDGQNARSLWPLLQNAIARGDAVFPMSSGEQIRDFMPVTQAADVLARLARRGCDDGIVNICSGQPVSVRSQVEQWIAFAAADIEPILGHYPRPDYEPLAFWGDTQLLRSLV